MAGINSLCDWSSAKERRSRVQAWSLVLFLLSPSFWAVKFYSNSHRLRHNYGSVAIMPHLPFLSTWGSLGDVMALMFGIKLLVSSQLLQSGLADRSLQMVVSDQSDSTNLSWRHFDHVWPWRCWQVQQPVPVSSRLVCSLIVVFWLVEGVMGVLCGVCQSYVCFCWFLYSRSYCTNQQDVASLVSVIWRTVAHLSSLPFSSGVLMD